MRAIWRGCSSPSRGLHTVAQYLVNQAKQSVSVSSALIPIVDQENWLLTRCGGWGQASLGERFSLATAFLGAVPLQLCPQVQTVEWVPEPAHPRSMLWYMWH